MSVRLAIGIVKFGHEIWTMFRPWRHLKIARNKRRARLGKPLLPITKDDDGMLPKGTQTYTGIAILVLTPWLAKWGITSEESQLYVTAASTVVGGVIAVLGRLRSERKAAEVGK